MIKLQFRDRSEHCIGLAAPSVTIGRDPSNDLIIDDTSISDFHAEIVNEADGLAVIDLVSATGTFVNERRVRSRQRLEPWDAVRLGNVEFEVNDPSVPRPSDWALRSQSKLLADQFYSLNPTTVIGRGAECDVTIDDALLSRRHAQFTVDARGETLHLRDLSSANGTFVNGVRVSDSTLRRGDEVRLGSRRFIVVGPETAVAAAAGQSEDLTMLSGTRIDEVDADALAPRTEVLRGDGPAAWLEEQTDFVQEGTCLELHDVTCRVGRTEGNDIVIPDSSVSRLHATLTSRGTAWSIEDAGSSNGVLVNGNRVEAAVLADGDVITLGRATLIFHCEPT